MRKISLEIYSYDELKEYTKEKVIEQLLKEIIENSSYRFLESRFPLATKKSEEMKTPWYLGSYILRYYTKEIENIARTHEYLSDGTLWNANYDLI